MLTYEGDISNYIEVNINKNPDGTFKWLKLHLVDKIITRVVLTFSASLKSRETPTRKPLLHKYRYSRGRKCVWNYMAAVSMLSYLQGSKQPDISMTVHHCTRFFNNPLLVHERAIIHIAKYPAITSTYTDLSYGNIWLSTIRVVYRPDK